MIVVPMLQKNPGAEAQPQLGLHGEEDEIRKYDHAAQFLAMSEEYPLLSAEAEEKLVRKVDWIMIPVLFLIATFGAVDKVSLSTAAIYGLVTDTHLQGQQYSWLGSILSLGVCRPTSLLIPIT